MRKYLTWMTHYKLINFSQKEALTWKEKFEQEAEIKKLKEQRVAQEAEEARVKNEEELAKGKGKLDKIDEEEDMPELIQNDDTVYKKGDGVKVIDGIKLEGDENRLDEIESL